MQYFVFPVACYSVGGMCAPLNGSCGSRLLVFQQPQLYTSTHTGFTGFMWEAQNSLVSVCPAQTITAKVLLNKKLHSLPFSLPHLCSYAATVCLRPAAVNCCPHAGDTSWYTDQHKMKAEGLCSTHMHHDSLCCLSAAVFQPEELCTCPASVQRAVQRRLWTDEVDLWAASVWILFTVSRWTSATV